MLSENLSDFSLSKLEAILSSSSQNSEVCGVVHSCKSALVKTLFFPGQHDIFEERHLFLLTSMYKVSYSSEATAIIKLYLECNPICIDLILSQFIQCTADFAYYSVHS